MVAVDGAGSVAGAWSLMSWSLISWAVTTSSFYFACPVKGDMAMPRRCPLQQLEFAIGVRVMSPGAKNCNSRVPPMLFDFDI